jgi:hypothetical protein
MDDDAVLGEVEQEAWAAFGPILELLPAALDS